MYTISKTFTFDAAHQLEGLPPAHKCGNVHGHTYTVEIILCTNSLTPEGWVYDFGQLAPVKHWIDSNWDHKFLNDEVNFQTTSENLARHLYEVVERMLHLPNGTTLSCIRVSETPTTYAEYSR